MRMIATELNKHCSYQHHLPSKLRDRLTQMFYFRQPPVASILQARSKNFLLRQKSLIAAMTAAGIIVNHCNHMIQHHKRQGHKFVDAILYIFCHLTRMQIVQSIGEVYKVNADNSTLNECFECVFGTKGRHYFEDNTNGRVNWGDLGIDDNILEIKKHMADISAYASKLRRSLHGYKFMIQVNKYLPQVEGEVLATVCPHRGTVRRPILLTGNEPKTLVKGWQTKDWMNFFVKESGVGPMICKLRTPSKQPKMTIHMVARSGKRSGRRVTFGKGVK